MAKYQRLAEAQIRKAEAEGQLKGLSGEGKPLPHRPGDAYIDSADAIGHRIMAEAGALPEEIKLKQQVKAARDALRNASEAGKKEAMRQLADLELKLAIAEEARRKFLK